MRAYLQAGTVLAELDDISPLLLSQIKVRIENDVAGLGSTTCLACGQPTSVHAFFIQKSQNEITYGPNAGRYETQVCKSWDATTGY